MICTAWPSACSALMCCLSVSPTRPTRCSREDEEGSEARARRAGEGCGGGGGRRDELGCALWFSGTSLEISRLSSAWPSSSSRIFLRSSSAAIAGGVVAAVSNGKHQRPPEARKGGQKWRLWRLPRSTNLPKRHLLSIS